MKDKLDKLIKYTGIYPVHPCNELLFAHLIIQEVQSKLTCAQWNDYANELEGIMLNELDEHLPSTKCSSLELGRCILMLRASDEQKIDSLLAALELI